jgi:acyl-CoA synthetase (AMP-forming)/AMP-acid ligase II
VRGGLLDPAVSPGLVLGDPRSRGAAPALIDASGVVSYEELADRVDEVSAMLGAARRLVAIPMGRTVDSVVAYLAALQGGHPAIVIAPEHAQPTIDGYDVDVEFRASATGRLDLIERRPGTAHDLHPDLALLLSTSGTTGSPRLVRLSHDNLRSNALSIATYLDLAADDCAPTVLPLRYCYGLSVLNSHLAVGASVLVTETSVVDECFWTAFRAAGCTSLAGVPYTFGLLDRSGFADRDLPTLRYVTQAGGRMDPADVRRYADLGARRGWLLFVMYGQTEATARMAYLPPELAAKHPSAVGVAVPGGRLSIEQLPSDQEVSLPADVGELVYEGPNVMLGYAERPSDLAAGRTVERLRTGDLARWTRMGQVEILGRLDRTAKAFGLRIDLDRVERMLAEHGGRASVVAVGDRLHVFVTGRADRARVASAVADFCGLPLHAVEVTALATVPHTESGKVDRAALERHAGPVSAGEPAQEAADAPTDVQSVRDEYAQLLARPDATPDDSFVSLRGDSLSYVELSVRLADRLGRLPSNWHTTPIRDLAALGTPPSRRRTIVESSVVLRAVAIVLVVGTHANLFSLYGGAHLLLAIAGFNFARFQLADGSRAERRRRGLRAIAGVAVPSMVWIAAVALVTGFYSWSTVFFLNGFLHRSGWTVQWQFWFLEAMVWTMVALVALFGLAPIDRVERRAPFAVAFGAVCVGLAARYATVGIEAGALERYEVLEVFWCFALGWAVARADRAWQRVLVSVIAPLSVAGFFGQPEREVIIAAGVLVLVWVPGIALPRWAGTAAATLASASLYIYLTHWQVYPWLEDRYPLLAVVASLAVGIVVARVAQAATLKALASTRRRRIRQSAAVAS